MISPADYKKLEDLTISDEQLLEQAYCRLVAEGYYAGFSFADFLDIVLGRGEHRFNEFREMEANEKSKPKKIEVVYYEY